MLPGMRDKKLAVVCWAIMSLLAHGLSVPRLAAHISPRVLRWAFALDLLSPFYAADDRPEKPCLRIQTCRYLPQSLVSSIHYLVGATPDDLFKPIWGVASSTYT